MQGYYPGALVAFSRMKMYGSGIAVMNVQPSRLELLGNGFANIGVLFICLSIPLVVVALAVGLIGFGWSCMAMAVIAACVGIISYVIGRGCLEKAKAKVVQKLRS